MKITLPGTNKVWLQNNRTNVAPLGNLWSTMAIDLQSNLGVMRVSPRLKLAASTSDDSDLGIPVAFRWFDTKIWAICNTHIFSNGGFAGSTPWTDDSSSGFQTNYSGDESDLENFNGTLCATTTNGLYSKAPNGSGTGAWTSRDSLSTGNEHFLVYFKKYDRLYYANLGNRMWSIDNTWVVAHTTTTAPVDYSIILSPSATDQYMLTCGRATSDSIWLGTVNNDSQGRPGKVCVWDGISQQVTSEYELNNAQGALAMAIDPDHDNPYVMDTNGVLSAFNGSGFTEVGRLPFPFSTLPYNINDSDNERFIHPNGMYFTKNGTLRCLINNRANSGNVIENIPSGVWEWSKDQGFVHCVSATYNPAGSTTITDWGQNRVARVGALVSMNVLSTQAVDGTFLAGIAIYTDASTNISGIFFDNSLDTIQKKGYFVTDFIESAQVADSWDVWWATYKKFLTAGDAITFKYRNYEEQPTEGTITWVDTTHFTIPNSSVNVGNYWTSGTGGEVEILRGVGGALCAHITNAVNNAGTWTVTIDETATGATTTTATARFQKWIKIEPANVPLSESDWNQWAIGSDSTARVQIKGCFTWTGAGELYKGILTSNEDIKATK